MSHATYQNKWVECMQELMEQVQIEYLPVDAKENGQHFEPGFQHFALLYIKYLQIYRKLEECHDQMVHPQKRGSIKKVLKSTIIRILELKEQLITFNLRPLNRFVALDEVLTDLKLNPETVEWKVPRYFLDGKECKEEIEDKQHKIDHWLGVFGMPLEPDDLLDKKDPFEVGLTTDQAVAIIQKNERGRMNIVKADHRVQFFKASKKDASKKQESAEDPLESQVLAATRIAAHWKRKVDRRRFLKMREEEFEFLGMAPPKKDKGETDVIAEMQKHRENRKKMQEDADDVFEKALKQQLEWLQKKKGADIKAELLEERRQWILEYCQDPEHGKEFPEKFDAFYQRFDQNNEDEEGDKGKDGKKGKDAKGKDDKAKGKGGKGGKKGKDGDGEEEPLEVGVGYSAVVQQFVEQIKQYTEQWENKDESNNFDQRHDLELARKSVYPIVEAELRALVDDQMREELANLKLLYDEVKKKKKPPKLKKPKKPKPPKKWCAAVGMITNREDCVPDLVEQGILKKVTPSKLEDFLGEYHFLGAMQRSPQYTFCPPPSAQMIRSLLVEHCVLPLAQTDIRQKAPKNLTARSLLLYGPKGSGKSMLARAIAAETGATFFDLSPAVIEGKSTQGKVGSTLLVYKVFICAQDMAPSVIYIDNVEQVFQATKKKKGGDAGTAPSRIKKDLQAAINQVKRFDEANEQDRILFIGATSRPFADGVDVAGLKDSFDEKVWVSFPEYGSRVVLWQRFMENHGVTVDPVKLNISTLARVSEGYPAGSIKQTVDRVLTARRVQQLKNRPLKVQEFIGPLSRTAFCWKEELDQFRTFDHLITGEKAREDAKNAPPEAAQPKKKGKGK